MTGLSSRLWRLSHASADAPRGAPPKGGTWNLEELAIDSRLQVLSCHTWEICFGGETLAKEELPPEASYGPEPRPETLGIARSFMCFAIKIHKTPKQILFKILLKSYYCPNEILMESKWNPT